MFENVEQLEKEIIEFEQNVLASRDLIISLRNINDTIKSQNEMMGKELQKVVAQLKAVPGEIEEDNIAFQNALSESNKSLYDANKKDLDAYNLEIQKAVDSIHAYEKEIENKSNDLIASLNSQLNQTQSDFLNNTQKIVELIHSYEATLESRNKDVINETKDMLANYIESAEHSFKEESDKYTKELIASVTEMKRYEQLLDAKYNELIAQAQKTNEGLLNQINITYKAVNSKSTILMAMIIICIIVSAIAIIL